MRLGSGLWEIGQRALMVLESSIESGESDPGLHQLVKELPALVAEATEFLDTLFLPTLAGARDEGRIKCDGLDDAWPAYYSASKVTVFAEMMHPLAALRRDQILMTMVQRLSAVAVLIRLDDAMISDCLDGRGLNEVVTDITRLNLCLVQPKNLIAMLDATLAQGEKEVAQAGATARHFENRAMKGEVFAWLDVNMSSFSSMDAAAGAIAGKIAPIAWRTARDWVKDWKKARQ